MTDLPATKGQLLSIVERVEQLDCEIKDKNADKSEVFKEAKAGGWHIPTLKAAIKLRAQDPSERHEQGALLETYLIALGMEP